MASFTDQIMSYSPYQQQLPVDDMIRVGMQKQAAYEEGVAKVQGYIDSVAGLDVVKDIHKDYLTQLTTQLNSEISKVLSEDFSNKNLQGRIGGLTGTIIKDPIIQNAVLSTARYKAELGKVEKARQDGKSNPSNEWLWQTQSQSWLNDGDAKSQYNAQYVPYRDYRKKVMDAIKEVAPSSRLTQLPFQMNGNTPVLDEKGNPVLDYAMLETSVEAKDINHIRAAVSAALDEGDIQQLQIDGAYHFRGSTPENMKEILDKNYQGKIDDLNDRRKVAQLKKMQNVDNKPYQAAVDAQVKQLEEEGKSLIQMYTEDFKDLNTNPDGFKSKFFISNYVNQIATAYSTQKETLKYLNNPYQEFIQKERAYALDLDKFKADIEYKNANLEIEKAKLAIAAQKAQEESEKDKKPLAGVFGGGGLNTAIDTAIIKPTEQSFLEELSGEEAALAASENQMLQTAFPNDWTMTERKAGLESNRKAWQEGRKVDDTFAKFFDQQDNVKNLIDQKRAVITRITKEVDANPAYNIETLAKGSKGLTLSGTNYTPGELATFKNKLNTEIMELRNVIPRTDNRGQAYSFNDEKAKTLSQKERALYDIYKKAYQGQKLSQGEQVVYDRLRGIQGEVINKYEANLTARQKALNDKLAGTLSTQNPRAYGTQPMDEKTKEAFLSQVGLFLGRADDMAKSVGASPNYDHETAKKYLTDNKTTFSTVIQGNTAYIKLANPSGKTQYIPVQRSDFEGVFGEGLWSPYQHIMDAIVHSGGKSTNVLNPKDRTNGWRTAAFNKTYFPNATKTGVKADLEPNTDGTLQVVLYMYDGDTDQWKAKPVGSATTPKEAFDFFGKVTDDMIRNYFK